jgi:hypothetical protein
MLAAKDFYLYGPNDWFGVTLTFDNDAHSRQYESGAALPADRIAALKGGSQPQNSYMGFMRARHLSCPDFEPYRVDARVRGFLLGREAESSSHGDVDPGRRMADCRLAEVSCRCRSITSEMRQGAWKGLPVEASVD